MNRFFQILLAGDGNVEEPESKFTLLTDHSYSWWVEPRNVFKDGVNYWTTIGYDGAAYIHKYDGQNITSVLLRNFGVRDEHNAPSFLLRDNDILTVCHPRNSTNFTAKNLSYDFQNLGETIYINDDAGFVGANYSQLFEIGGRTFLFCREQHQQWGVTWSDDDGVNWSQRKLFLQNEDLPSKDFMYISGVKHNEKIVFGIYSHPDSGDANRFYLVEFDGITGEVSEAGTSLGNLFDIGFTVVSTTSLTALFQPNVGNKIRFLDISLSENATKINVLFCHFLGDNSNGDYVFKQYDRASLAPEVEEVIIQHGYDTYVTYFGGAYFVQTDNGEWDGRIYLAREEMDVWYVEEWSYNSGIFEKVKEIDRLASGSVGLSLTRPEPPFNSMDGGLKIIYQKGNYYETYTDWDNEIIGVQ